MNNRRIIGFILVVILFIGFGCRQSGDGTPGAVKKQTIKLSHSHQASFSSEIHIAAWIFQKWVNENSDNLDVKIYANNALGEEREVYEGMQLGTGADCIISGTAILSNFVPKIGVLDYPYLWKNYSHVHRSLDGEVGNFLESELQENGFKVLAWMDSWGYRNVVTSDRKVTEPQDMRGLKLRTIQSPTYIATMNMMGANATPMPFGEVYTGMQTGVLDGFEHTASVVVANKFYEVSDYMAKTEHLFGPLVFAFSLKEWEKLSEADRKVIMEGAGMARDIQRALAPVKDRESIEFLKENGIKINDINTETFEKQAIPIQDSLAKEVGAIDLLDEIRSLK